MELETFSYEPLQERHIRVLEIEPLSHASNILSCRCIHVSLDDRSQKYVAVSYTWGSEQKPCQLLVNGRILNITQSVHDIFQSKIMAAPGTRLWIDAVCINQDDLDEKATQVGVMRDVYSNAESTRVWLGPRSEDSDLAISFTEELWSILPEFQTGKIERVTSYYAAKYPEGALEWVALAHLLERPWFTRTWVIQEVALATRAEIVCGNNILRWDTLEQVIDELFALDFAGMVEKSRSRSRDLHLSHGPPGLVKVRNLCELRINLKAQQPRSILGLMRRFVRSSTTEPSDKIYGVLGLATDVDNPVFSPDYTKPPGTLFRDFTRFLITRDAKLDILRYAGAEKKHGGPGLPSWAYTYYLDLFEKGRLGFYPVTTIKKPDFLFSDDGNKLILRGFIIDEIRHLGLIFSATDGLAPGDLWSTNYYDWYCQTKNMFQSTGQDDEVLWRTLLANKITNGKDISLSVPEKEPDQSWEEKFLAFESIFAKISLDCSFEEATQLILSPEGEKARDFRYELLQATICRRFCVLRSGSVGLMPGEARHGDLVAAFLGAQVLFVIRPLRTDDYGNQQYQLVGECYVHDRMNGQVMELGLEIQDIVLV
jgi:hypothetical protein